MGCMSGKSYKANIHVRRSDIQKAPQLVSKGTNHQNRGPIRRMRAMDKEKNSSRARLGI